jgi:hypothetical protein
MDALVASLLSTLLAGGNSAIVVLLIFVCYALWAERGRLLEQNEISMKRLDGVAAAQAESTRAIVASIDGVRMAMVAARRSATAGRSEP